MPRSRKGCNTCKKRHRKCDETKPACRMCEAYGLQCEGYAVTLRWTNDVAASGPPSGSRRQLQGTADHRRQDTKHLQRKQPAAISGSSGGGSRQRCRPGSELGGLATSGISSPHDSYTSKRSYSNSSSNKDRPVLLPRPEALSANAPPLDGQSPEDLALPGNTHTTSHPDLRIQPADHDGDTFRLLDDFTSDTVYGLYSTSRDSLFASQLDALARTSKALRTILAALHLYFLNPKAPGANFQEYSTQSIHLFQRELDHYDGVPDAAILTAGLFICTLNLVQSLPWSPTLKHMINVFGIPGTGMPCLSDPLCHPMMRSTIEAMGLMDLPTLIRGRIPSTFGIWRDVRASQPNFVEADVSPFDHTELVSALPRSLLDLLARIEEPGAENALLAWPGQVGEIPLCHHWESYRLAGILNCRKFNRAKKQAGWGRDNTGPPGQATPAVPSNDVLVARIVAHLDAILVSSDRAEYSSYLTLNAIFFPYAAARLEIAVLQRHNQLLGHLRRIKSSARAYAATENERMLEAMLDEAYETKNDFYDIDEECRRRGVEISLF
ncbi:hypothetical protein NLU13_1779 [Sarocladium strictum]|uniref:Zn(2)-C6 fungal-type domain-containing protein n=1 Tax=Sarocladium strictum TaxID=5046 RepID=A0AA39LCJ3_SARSR|nr:hypothetical protein NLU13_1779 [Sarocladium strictum]